MSNFNWENHESLVYPLADVLGFDVKILRSYGGLMGSADVEIVLGDLRIETTCTIMDGQVFPERDEACMLVHVMGDLGLLVTYSKKTAEVNLLVLDLSKVKGDDRGNTANVLFGGALDVAHVTHRAGDAIVAGYRNMADDHSGEWVALSKVQLSALKLGLGG